MTKVIVDNVTNNLSTTDIKVISGVKKYIIIIITTITSIATVTTNIATIK